jgi:hypothetical protein
VSDTGNFPDGFLEAAPTVARIHLQHATGQYDVTDVQLAQSGVNLLSKRWSTKTANCVRWILSTLPRDAQTTALHRQLEALEQNH